MFRITAASARKVCVMNRIAVIPVVLFALVVGAGTAPAQEKAGVFVDGALAVPGAPTGGQTVPSKYSAQNAAIDALPIAAMRLRHLTDDQRREIYGQLQGKAGTLALSPGHAMIGAEIPADIALRDLKPAPESVTAKFTELRGTSYLVEGSDVLIVGTNNVVLAVLSGR
jgi:hypothetical protein